jgi:hypothetical protein
VWRADARPENSEKKRALTQPISRAGAFVKNLQPDQRDVVPALAPE